MDTKKTEVVDFRRNKLRIFPGRKYFDYPDGEDLVGKLIYTNTIGGTIGASLGSLRCLSNPPIKGFIPKLFIISKYAFPLMGAASTYVVTAYHATNLRKVDEPFNHFLAGAAAGTILGSVVGNFHILSAAILGAIGYGIKATVMMGFRAGDPIDYAHGTYPSYIMRMKNRIRNTTVEYEPHTWSREPPKELTT